MHAPGSRSARPMTVEITEETGKPVAGAAVSFHLPEDGPGGTLRQRAAHRSRDHRRAGPGVAARTAGQSRPRALPDSDRGIEGAGAGGPDFGAIRGRAGQRGCRGIQQRKSEMGDRRCAGGRRRGGGDPGRTVVESGHGGSSDASRGGGDHVAAGHDRASHDHGGVAMKAAILFVALAPAAFGQFALYRLDGEAERPAGAVCDLGPGYPGEARTARFRLRNVSDAAAVASTLSVNGAGFELALAPKLPVGLGPQEAFDFGVVFQASQPASYSAGLDAGGVSTILTASVLPAITVSGGIAFGTVEAGSSAIRRVVLSNLTSWALPVPPVSVTGEAYAIASGPPGGFVLQPGDTAGVEIRFQPPGAGNWTGALAVGERSYPLSGSVAAPALPKPAVTVELAEAASARTGTVAIAFDGPAKTSGTGKLTDLDDAGGPRGRAVAGVPVPRGGHGHSAGPVPDRHDGGEHHLHGRAGRHSRAPGGRDPCGGCAAYGSNGHAGRGDDRGPAGRVRQYEERRGDRLHVLRRGGNALPAIAVDNTAEFARYFAGSDAGGWFALRSVFPVNGDGSAIREFAVEMRNAAGNTATGRLRF